MIVDGDATNTGGAASLSNDFEDQSTDRQTVTLGVYDATSYAFDANRGGMMLAPDARLSNATNKAANIEGAWGEMT